MSPSPRLAIGSSRIALIQVLLVLVCIACVVGRFIVTKPQGPNPTLQLLESLQTESDHAASALVQENELRRQGREDELFRPRDIRLNAEYVWNEQQEALQQALGDADLGRLSTLVFLEQPGEVSRELRRLHNRISGVTLGNRLMIFAGMSLLMTLGLIVYGKRPEKYVSRTREDPDQDETSRPESICITPINS